MNKEEMQKDLKKVYDATAQYLQKLLDLNPNQASLAIINLQQSVWWAEKAIAEAKPKLENG